MQTFIVGCISRIYPILLIHNNLDQVRSLYNNYIFYINEPELK